MKNLNKKHKSGWLCSLNGRVFPLLKCSLLFDFKAFMPTVV